MNRNSDKFRSLFIGVFCLLLALSNTAISQLTDKESAIDAAIQKTWARFLGELNENDAGGAAKCIRPAIRKQYLEIFESMGNQLHELSADWSEIKAVSLAEAFSEYTIFRGAGADERMHIMTFVKSRNGSWIIYAL